MIDIAQYHVPVLLDEAMTALAIRSDGTYLDTTAGGGGHLRAIARRLGAGGTLIGTDRDPQAIAHIRAHPPETAARVILDVCRFSRFPQALSAHGIPAVDGLLLDLGVSSRHIDDVGRGFSYMADAPLDMRMNPGDPRTALDVIRQSSVEELTKILEDFGEIRHPERMARAIFAARASIVTSGDLKRCLEREYGPTMDIKALAKLFQALRIAVNRELDELRDCLPCLAEGVRPGGRVVVIAYHSLEDRMVKNFMRDAEGRCTCPPSFPVCTCGKVILFKRITRKAVTAGEAEIQRNPRSRSARLRAAERV